MLLHGISHGHVIHSFLYQAISNTTVTSSDSARVTALYLGHSERTMMAHYQTVVDLKSRRRIVEALSEDDEAVLNTLPRNIDDEVVRPTTSTSATAHQACGPSTSAAGQQGSRRSPTSSVTLNLGETVQIRDDSGNRSIARLTGFQKDGLTALSKLL